MIVKLENGNWAVKNEETGWTIELVRYSDPDRLNLADSAAVYMNKSDKDNVKRPLQILKRRDTLTIFRGEHAAFKYYDVPKQVYDHLVTYQTLQMRAAGGNRANVSDGYTMPADKMKNPELVEQMLIEAMEKYHKLAEVETPQVARSIQPVNSNMPIFKLQWNFQTLIEALAPQRIWTKGAQSLTRMCVNDMFSLLFQMDAELWTLVEEYFGAHRHEWDKVQTKLRTKYVTVGELVGMLEEYMQKNESGDLDSVEEVMRRLFGQSKSVWGD